MKGREGMSETPRKLAAMHEAYGKEPGLTCGKCPHLIRKEYGRIYFKCAGYGDTNAVSTDWAKKWCACGLITKEDISLLVPMVNQIKHMPKRKTVFEQIPGQMEMEGIP